VTTPSPEILVSRAAYDRWTGLLHDAAPGARWVTITAAGEIGAVAAGGPVPLAVPVPEVLWLSIDTFFDGTVTPMLELALRSEILRWTHTASAGVDAPFFGDLARRGVRLSTTHVNGISIAEYVLAQVLACYQPSAQWRADQTERRWRRVEFREVHGTTWLVIGLGGIGAAVAERARAFGATVLGVRRNPTGDEPVDELHRPDAIAELVPRADVVVLAVPGSDTTSGLVDAAFLAAMRPGSILVNVARGSLVDEPALLAALDRGVPERAILDVFATEPLPADSRLWAHPSVVATAHTSAGGIGRHDRAAAAFAENLRRWVGGRPIEHEVAPADLPSAAQAWAIPAEDPT
jgi:phosphoglycerate dehydrogenase-like enzyme